MNWLVDAQLPPELAHWLHAQGERAVHADQLLIKEDKDLAQWAAQQGFIIITKDLDLVELHVRLDPSPSLLYLSWPNMKKEELLKRFVGYWEKLKSSFQQHAWVELGEKGLHLHW